MLKLRNKLFDYIETVLLESTWESTVLSSNTELTGIVTDIEDPKECLDSILLGFYLL